jgi:CHAT domain-containing protein
LNALEIQIAHLGGTDEIRSGFRARHESYFRDYIDLLVTLGRPEHAVDILERSRARSLLELLRQAHVDFRQGIDPQLLAQERSLRDAIQAKTESRIDLLAEQQTAAEAARIRKELEALVEQYKDVEDRIRAASPRYAALTQPRPLSARQIQQQLLDPDTVLLEYSVGENRSFVFAVTSTSLSSYELPKRSRLEAEGKRVYELLTARTGLLDGKAQTARTTQIERADVEFPKAAGALSALVLGPVAKELHHKRLVIVSDGVLHYIPFAALPDPTANRSRSMKPLVVDHEIVNLPSASVLALLREQDRGHPSHPGKIAVLADPVFARSDPRVHVNIRSAGVLPTSFTEVANAPSTSAYPDELNRSANDVLGSSKHVRLPRLLFTREEAEAITGAASPRKVLKALDFEASRATALNPALQQYRTVHFATHGLIDTEHPELSGLVLSLVNKNGQPQNGFLDLNDIYNLNLPVHLVVLSACKTALGKQVDGEGLIGLTRGFMYAGSPRIVASLWTVSDVATARLMSLFYKAMERDGMSAAAALRTAQVQLWKTQRWSSPYYWSAFQMQGDWK